MKNLQAKVSATGLTALGWMVAAPAALAQTTTAINTSQLSTTIALGSEDPGDIIGAVINVALGFLVFVAVIIILLGGFRWMTAAGNEEKVESAKKLLVAAVIGLIIILAAWGISLFALESIGTATNTSFS